MLARVSEEDRKREFAGREYEYLGQVLLANEARGDQRVGLQLSLSTASIGAVGFLLQASGQTSTGAQLNQLIVVAAALLMLALVTGLHTTRRIARRNARTDELKHRVDDLRDFLATDAGVREEWHTFPKERIQGRWKGGLAGLLRVTNAVSAAVMLAIVAQHAGAESMIVAVLAGAGFVLGLGLHHIAARGGARHAVESGG